MRPELAPQIEQFIHDNPQGVLTSFRRNGMPQLLRAPRCSVLVSHADWALARMREALKK